MTAIAMGAPLDPNAFTSLGALSVASGALTINTSTLSMSGAASFSGINYVQPGGGPDLAVFTFESINVAGAASITLTGSRPLVLLSKSTATILPALSLNGPMGINVAGSGGTVLGGGAGGWSNGGTFASGGGAGGGGGAYGAFTPIVGAGGGGFGGAGAAGAYAYALHGYGGPTYGNLLDSLVAGSGGGGGTEGATPSAGGGSGGGAIEIGALGAITLGIINANGGNAQTFGGRAGGGSGGAIFLHGSSLSYTSLNVNGGQAYDLGGGGGGGRIVEAGQSYTLGGGLGTASLLGSGSVAGSGFNQGSAGVRTLAPGTTTIPSGRSITLTSAPLVSGGAFFYQPRLEVYIRNNLTVDTGATVSLGESEVLAPDAALSVNGTFNTGQFAQTVLSLAGTGTVNINEGGRLELRDGLHAFVGAIAGPGTLAKTDASEAALNAYVDVGTIDVEAGTLRANNGLYARVKTGPGTLIVNGPPDSLGTGMDVMEGTVHFQSDSLAPALLTVNGSATLAVDDSELVKSIVGNSASAKIYALGTSSLGDATRVDGFFHRGVFVQSGSTTINNRGFASLGVHTTIDGTLTAPNGIALPTGASLEGTGTVAAKLAAGFGSRIEANGSLQLGADAVNGFASDGELATNAHAVTIHDSNEAVLGSLTHLGQGTSGGALIAGQAVPGETKVRFLIEEGKNLMGRGSVTGNVKNNGYVGGDGSAAGEQIVFAAGYTVSGIGTFENVDFQGVFAPGLSPGVVDAKNLSISGSLALELGGASPGNGMGHHDQVNDAGVLSLGAAAELKLLSYGNYLPSVGQQFEIVTAATDIDGAFATMTIDPWFIAQGIAFDLISNDDSLVAQAIAVSGDFNADGEIDGSDFLQWQSSLGQQGLNLAADADRNGQVDASDLAIWQTQFAAAHGATFPSGGPVPEPGALTVATLAASMIGMLRFRGSKRVQFE